MSRWIRVNNRLSSFDHTLVSTSSATHSNLDTTSQSNPDLDLATVPNPDLDTNSQSNPDLDVTTVPTSDLDSATQSNSPSDSDSDSESNSISDFKMSDSDTTTRPKVDVHLTPSAISIPAFSGEDPTYDVNTFFRHCEAYIRHHNITESDRKLAIVLSSLQPGSRASDITSQDELSQVIDTLTYDDFKQHFMRAFLPATATSLDWLFNIVQTVRQNDTTDIERVLSKAGTINNQARLSLSQTDWTQLMDPTTNTHGTIKTQDFFKLTQLLITCLLVPDDIVAELRSKEIKPDTHIAQLVRDTAAKVSKRRPQAALNPQQTKYKPPTSKHEQPSSSSNTPPKQSSKQRYCTHHGQCNHVTKDCRVLKQNTRPWCSYHQTTKHDNLECYAQQRGHAHYQQHPSNCQQMSNVAPHQPHLSNDAPPRTYPPRYQSRPNYGYTQPHPTSHVPFRQQQQQPRQQQQTQHHFPELAYQQPLP